jgi:protein SCO1/2
MATKTKNSKTWVKFSAIFGLLALPTLIFYFFVFTGVHHVSRLPFYGPRRIVDTTYHGKTIKDTVFHEIPPFRLMKSDSSWLDSRRLDGYIYVANYLDFGQLDKIPDEVIYVAADVLDAFPEIYFVTHFENYHGQELPLPSSFTKKLEGKDTSWIYITGPQATMDSLRTYAYFAPDPDITIQKDPYSLMLIDKEKRIRGYYNPILAKDSKRIKDEIAYLKREYELNYRTHRYYKYDDKIEQKRK